MTFKNMARNAARAVSSDRTGNRGAADIAAIGRD
jgi:hypothetical protein